MPAITFLETLRKKSWKILRFWMVHGCLKLAEPRFSPCSYVAQMGRVPKNINTLVICRFADFRKASGYLCPRQLGWLWKRTLLSTAMYDLSAISMQCRWRPTILGYVLPTSWANSFIWQKRIHWKRSDANSSMQRKEIKIVKKNFESTRLSKNTLHIIQYSQIAHVQVSITPSLVCYPNCAQVDLFGY